MGILVSAVAALSMFYPDAKNVEDPENRMLQITRLIAKMPTLAAAATGALYGPRHGGANEAFSVTGRNRSSTSP